MNRLSFYTTALLLAAVSCCSAPESSSKGGDNGGQNTEDPFAPVPGGETVASIQAVNCEKVARVIGLTPSGENLPNPNSTLKRFGMASTDFGNMWDAGNGSVFCIFGDNFNDRGGDWISNAIAVTTDRKLDDGLYYDSMLWDKATNHRKEIIHRLDGEVTCIPTGGFSVKTVAGVRQYVNFMAIKEWNTGGEADNWTCHYSELAYSDDFGQSWTRSGVRWDGGSQFVQIAYVVSDDYVYMWGTKSGRHSSVCVARVSPKKVLDKNAYQYWNGKSWVADERQAVCVTNGHVSEMTVRYNSYYKRYIMMYLSVKQRKLVYRDAAAPEGEWSAEKPILPGTYGPSIHPWFCDGRDLWFVSSDVTLGRNVGQSYDTWHIFLYHASLQADPDEFNMVWEPGFEYDPDQAISYKTLWEMENVMSSHDAHSGDLALRLTNNEPGVWKDACRQTIAVHKNNDYIVSGYVKGTVNDYTGTYLGVRMPDGNIYDINTPVKTDTWTQFTKEFNSGDNTSLVVFFGTWGAEGLSVTVDDIKLTPR